MGSLPCIPPVKRRRNNECHTSHIDLREVPQKEEDNDNEMGVGKRLHHLNSNKAKVSYRPRSRFLSKNREFRRVEKIKEMRWIVQPLIWITLTNATKRSLTRSHRT